MERRGFTLIELIIVCIILGILASIALPKYVKTVENSRVAEAKNMLGAIREAQLRYTAEYDVYTTDPNKLDINVSMPGRYYDFALIPGADPNNVIDERLANATRNGQEVGGGYSLNYAIAINESGRFAIMSGIGPPM